MEQETTAGAAADADLEAAVRLHRAEDFAAAEALYGKVLAARPGDPRAFHNLGALLLRWGMTLRGQGRLLEAEARLRRAAAFPAAEADAEAELGLTLSMLGRPRDAEASYRRALARRSDDVTTLANLAATLKQLNREREAEPLFRRAIAIDPGHVAALRNYGVLLKDDARPAEAKVVYLQAAKLDAGLDASLQGHLALSPMVRSAADIEDQRASFESGIAAFAADPRAFSYQGEKLNIPWYYLAYQARDDRQTLERTAEALAARIPGLDAVAPRLGAWRDPRSEGRRIRVAFCSEYLHGHTIGRLYRGLVARLDRARFEVVVLHGPYGRRDAFRDELDRLADRALVLPMAAEAQHRLVADLAPDVLFYPDIGMSSQTYFLAHARLAPVQATSWGHPNTTGLTSLDYFISSDLIEPPDAEASYTERLVRLRRLPCFYETPTFPEAAPREALRLPAQGVLYGCPQTLFKFHPDFDPVLAQIAQGDPTGHIVLVEAQIAAWTQVLKARWAASFPILLDRVHFLPRLTHEGFMAHLAHIDVLLDPLHFGSGNTLYEGMALGTPIVTWPGRFARGRIVAGAYAQMGVEDPPVAASPQDYAALALALGRDPGRRTRLKAELQEKTHASLYEDLAAVREFELFLSAAVDAAARGERLPAGWRPDETEIVR